MDTTGKEAFISAGSDLQFSILSKIDDGELVKSINKQFRNSAQLHIEVLAENKPITVSEYIWLTKNLPSLGYCTNGRQLNAGQQFKCVVVNTRTSMFGNQSQCVQYVWQSSMIIGHISVCGMSTAISTETHDNLVNDLKTINSMVDIRALFYLYKKRAETINCTKPTEKALIWAKTVLANLEMPNEILYMYFYMNCTIMGINTNKYHKAMFGDSIGIEDQYSEYAETTMKVQFSNIALLVKLIPEMRDIIMRYLDFIAAVETIKLTL
jgi:hypothetical protein